MKRIAPLLLVLVLIPCLIVPASASATNQDIIDTMEDLLMHNDHDIGSIAYNIYSQLYQIKTHIIDTLTPVFEDMQARIRSIQGKLSGVFDGESLSVGSLLALVADYMRSTVDYLGWIDSEVSAIEGNVVSILQEIYTKGALTIGECVKGIRTYVVSIDGKMDSVVSSLRELVDGLVDGGKDQVLEEVGENLLVQDNMDMMGDIIETAPSIDQSGIDGAIGEVNGKFNGITTDQYGLEFFGALGQIANSNAFKQLIPTAGMLSVISFALFGRVF